MPASAARIVPRVNQENRLNWAEQFRLAMQQRDSAILRKMANEARRDEARMYLAVLAELVDFDSRKWAVLHTAWLGMLPSKRVR